MYQAFISHHSPHIHSIIYDLIDVEITTINLLI